LYLYNYNHSDLYITTVIVFQFIQTVLYLHIYIPVYRGCFGRDRMVVGFTTTYAISAYHH
jgi:hypothetical protein